MAEAVETYYTNGQLKSRANYKNDILNGLREFWDMDGQLKEHATYKNGVKQ